MILVIDNYDSFTYNLVQMLAVAGAEVEVLRNDAASSAAILKRQFDGIVISPGPGRPEDTGVCLELVRLEPEIPILGVCLGHQLIAHAYGATVDRAPEIMHGKTSAIRHLASGAFAGLADPMEATRYHSLRVRQETLPDTLVPTAWSEDGTLMGLEHRQLPYWGVQFHPESVLTRDGQALLENFLELTRRERRS